MVICAGNSEFAVARRDMCLNIMLFFDRYYLREARLSEIDVIQNVGVIGKKEAKNEKKRGIKDHKDDSTYKTSHVKQTS